MDTQIEITYTGRSYDGYFYIDVKPVRFSYQPTAHAAQEMFLHTVADGPDYGPGMVILVGNPIKKDGTPANRVIKPLIHISKLPQNLQDAITSNR